MYLGIDPGKHHLGLALIHANGKIHSTERVDTNMDHFGWRNEQITKHLYSFTNHQMVSGIGIELVPAMASTSVFRSLVSASSDVRVACRALFPRTPRFWLPPGSWKKAMGVKGNAGKKKYMGTLRGSFNLHEASEDEVDATALAMVAKSMYDAKLHTGMDYDANGEEINW